MSAGRLVRDSVSLAFDEPGRGDPPVVLVHGLACHRGFWPDQLEHFGR
jgi:pimeloyl-ACP methyl ester carboxylesterase